ncbi:MAG: T9SS type A sorting domain-containing protein [Candidatus Fermentibacteraceae bacterium]|nr:T9SS type A sorting domain-containing protein [Candidatus Fermentibacteraceae bacterium]
MCCVKTIWYTSMLVFSFGVGSASAMDVGETVDLTVPDNSYFPDTLRTRQFTCRALTEHAYFLVQDTSYIDLPDSSAIFQVIWDNIVGQAEIDSIAAQFEGAGVDVYGSVTSLFGAVPQTVNDDDRIWIVFADIPDYYPVPGAPMFVRLQSLVCTLPEDFDGDLNTGNNHDAIYVNIGAYKNVLGEPWQLIRGSLHTWSVASGFGQFLRIANNSIEDRWVIRGLGLFAQFMCYGLTSEYNGRLGLRAYIRDFSRGGGIELSSWCSGQTGRDFGINQGGEFLWFKYIEQRFGDDVISEIVISPKTGMTGIANSIDPSVPDSIAEETVIYPLYEDWLITNLVAHIAGGYAGGIYRYNFLDGTGYTFTMINSPASFMGEFSTYPIGTWIANPYYGISAQTFAAQYADFQGDYSLTGDTTVHFNGMFNQNTGSGSNLNGRWTVYRIVLLDDSTLQSVDSLEFDEFYNGTFSLEGLRTCLVLTNNNPGGTARIRYVLSQDTAPKDLFLAALQNGINMHYLQVYASLLREETQTPYGFDWAGPELELSRLNPDGSADSTAIIPMDFLSGTLWTGQAQAWTAGNYNLVCSGFDSLGVPHRDSILIAVGYGGTGKLILDIQTARLEIDAGILPQGAMASVVEANALGVSVSSDLPLGSTGIILSGFKTDPVALSFHQGLISFPAETAEGAVFRLDGEHWHKLNSYFLSGRMYSTVEGEGIYVFGDSPGLFSPEISTVPVFLGSSPNPFNSLVSFRFSMPQSGIVSLVVYDVSGRLVNTLASEQMPPGQHTVSWSGTDNSGIQIPSGVYFARFSAPGYSETVKLVRVRAGI